MFMYASCISEVSIKELQVLMSSQLTFKDQLLTSFDIDHIFQAVQYSGLQCNLEFHSCHFGSQTIEIMAKYLRAFSILPICGTVQELRCVCVCVFVCVCVCWGGGGGGGGGGGAG